MNDANYLTAITDLLKETEGKLQEAIKNNVDKGIIQQMQTVISYLRKEQKKILDKEKDN